MALPENLQQAIDDRNKKSLDPVSESAMDVVALEQQRERDVLQRQEDKEQMIAECHQFIGRIQAFNMVEKVVTVSSLVQLKQLKESKVYRAIPGSETWEKFCETMGYGSRHINEQLQNLEALGMQFLETVSNFQIGYRELRKLRKLTNEGNLLVSDSEVWIGDERIPLSPESKEDLEFALERLLDAKDAQIEEKTATIRANERVLESKQKLIVRQEKDLAKYEKEAESKGPEAFEKEFIQKMQNARVTIEGYLNQFDPSIRPLPEGYTPRMANEMMITLHALMRSIRASYDTAADTYGDPDLDGHGWVPPNMRTGRED